MKNMRQFFGAGALAFVAAACADIHSITAPNTDAIRDGALAGAASNAGNLRSGGVFAMTNDPTGNMIAAYYRAPDGSLTSAGAFATGGIGTGGGADPLRSQGSLIDDGPGDVGGHLLFAVNAGSNEISVLAIGTSELTLVGKVASGGVRPTSLTFHNDLLYVLHAGSGTINGFRVGRGGNLTPIPESTRPITGGSAADPSQISFTPDGHLLVVTGKTFNAIDTYIVTNDVPVGPMQNASAGLTPFGFAFDQQQHLVVSEAFGGAPNQAAASSYDVSRDGTVTAISPSVKDSQTAACWVVITANGRYAYVSNTGSSNVSSYHISADGSLTLLEAVAAATDPGSSPIDMSLTRGSRFLYVLNGLTGTIDGFSVAADGSLSRTAGAGGLPPYVQGIVAK